jgi:hypothetical protein
MLFNARQSTELVATEARHRLSIRATCQPIGWNKLLYRRGALEAINGLPAFIFKKIIYLFQDKSR